MAKPVSFETVREIALALPATEEGLSYGTPAFRVGGKLFARMHQDEDAVVVRVGFDERESLMERNPETCYITDHYRNHPAMLVRLNTVSQGDLESLIGESWRRVAPKRVLAAHDTRRSGA